MNYLKFLGLCLTCLLACARISAQTNKVPINEPNLNKPRLFDNLPDRIPVDKIELKKLLAGSFETGKQLPIRIAEKTMPDWNGKLISATSKYNNTIRTLIIHPGNFSGAALTLSSFTQPDGTVSFTGRIISFQHGDAYVLEKQDDQYYLIKKNYYDLINE
jgi:hypothetical protein